MEERHHETPARRRAIAGMSSLGPHRGRWPARLGEALAHAVESALLLAALLHHPLPTRAILGPRRGGATGDVVDLRADLVLLVAAAPASSLDGPAFRSSIPVCYCETASRTLRHRITNKSASPKRQRNNEAGSGTLRVA